MSGLSARLGLYLPTDNDIVDVNPINGNASKLDTVTNIQRITSYPPSNPLYPGQLFYYGPNKSLYRYDPAVTDPAALAYQNYIPYSSVSPDAPGGIVGQNKFTGLLANLQNRGDSSIGGSAIVVPVVAGHNYSVSWTGSFETKNAGGTYYANCCIMNLILAAQAGTGTPPITAGVQSWPVFPELVNGSVVNRFVSGFYEYNQTYSTSGNMAFAFYLQVSNDTPYPGVTPSATYGWAENPNTACFCIRDMGKYGGTL